MSQRLWGGGGGGSIVYFPPHNIKLTTAGINFCHMTRWNEPMKMFLFIYCAFRLNHHMLFFRQNRWCNTIVFKILWWM